ncbi:MAG: hypothetical protein J6Q05_04290 [Elusimicrobiaceae bacterium]|nr:hypothetical protein [Elusimicrobiaceae bacterium]
MPKIVVVVLVTILSLSGTHVFAQFRNAAKIARNSANLERALDRTLHGGSTVERPIIRTLPPPTKSIRFQVLPNVLPPGYQAYKNSINRVQVVANGQAFPCSGNKFDPWKKDMTTASWFPWIAYDWIKAHGERVLYEDQSQLAYDLDIFYKGEGDIRIGPDGHKVKLYALPVDNILYQPDGYRKPVALNSSDYFVVYDVTAKTGKIVDNIPEMYHLFKEPSNEIWKFVVKNRDYYIFSNGLMKNRGPFVFHDLGILYDVARFTNLHQSLVEQWLASSETGSLYTLLEKNTKLVWEQYTKPWAFQDVYKKFTRYSNDGPSEVKIMELPVEQVTWIDEKGVEHIYTRGKDVLISGPMWLKVMPRTEADKLYPAK